MSRPPTRAAKPGVAKRRRAAHKWTARKKVLRRGYEEAEMRIAREMRKNADVAPAAYYRVRPDDLRELQGDAQ